MVNFKFFLFFIFIFLTFPFLAYSQLQQPNIIYPTSKDSPVYAGKIKFEWTETGAEFYKYHVDLPNGESHEGITNENHFYIYSLEKGIYYWAVRSCGDEEGENCGSWSEANFEIISAPPGFLGGIVPCGRNYDDEATPHINEAEPCQFRHLFLLLKNILDFLLWKLGIIVLGILVIVVGVMFYFSWGSAEVLTKVKSVFKSALTGYILMFFAWLALNLLLGLLGFQIDIFGRWWLW